MIGIFNRTESWEKQFCYDLDNGWLATVENHNYQDIVVRLDSPERNFYWHHASGLAELPEFAESWVRESNGTLAPKFEQISDYLRVIEEPIEI
jgi:hypothetical protein